MSQATLRVQKISGHAGPIPGQGTQREETVSKLVDTTTCLSTRDVECRAKVAWHGHPGRGGWRGKAQGLDGTSRGKRLGMSRQLVYKGYIHEGLDRICRIRLG